MKVLGLFGALNHRLHFFGANLVAVWLFLISSGTPVRVLNAGELLQEY